jgi:hypothetical protein
MSQSVAGLAASRALHRAYWFYRAYRVEKALLDLRDAVERKYNPNQPRVPAGYPDGGQWTDGGGGSGGSSTRRRPSFFARLSPGSDLDADLLVDELEGLVRLAQAQGQGNGRRGPSASGFVALRNGSRMPATLRQETELFGLRLDLTRLERQIRNLDPNWRLPPSLTETIRGEIEATRAEVRAAENRLMELRVEAVGPGPYATESIPSRGPNAELRKGEQAELNVIMRRDGCTTCGTTDSGTPNGNSIGDHQPPSALVRPGEAQRIFPHCQSCSNIQGGHVRALKQLQRRMKK